MKQAMKKVGGGGKRSSNVNNQQQSAAKSPDAANAGVAKESPPSASHQLPGVSKNVSKSMKNSIKGSNRKYMGDSEPAGACPKLGRVS